MKNYELYFKRIVEIEENVLKRNSHVIEDVAKKMVETLRDGKSIYLFGCGHSHIIEEEAFYRAGGIVNIKPIFDTALMLHDGAYKSSKLEKMEAYGDFVFDRNSIGAGDMLFVFSTSGINGCPIEMALRAKQSGAVVVVMTSGEYKGKMKSRHSTGKYLEDVGDFVFDNCVPYGDGIIDIGGRNVAPCSTIASTLIWEMLVAQVAEIGKEEGFIPEFFISGNIEGGAAENMKYLQKYKGKIQYL